MPAHPRAGRDPAERRPEFKSLRFASRPYGMKDSRNVALSKPEVSGATLPGIAVKYLPMRTPKLSCAPILLVLLTLSPSLAMASGGPLGIDHVVPYDNSGIWARSNQKALMGATIVTVIGGSVLLGDENKLGDTFWRSLDSMAMSAAVAQGGKWIFQRERPSQTSNPDEWFKGTRYQSFPSGEVAAISGAVTPFVVAYGQDHPAVYALELLPLYDAVARVKVHGHWQSDVLVGWAIGTGAGIWAAHRQSPLILGWLPHGFEVGFVHHFKP